MKQMKNHCCKPLHAGISFLGIGAWLMLVGISLITASLAYDPAIHGKTAEVLRLLWVITMAGTLSLRIMSVQRHMMLALRFRQMPILPRFCCLLLLTLLPPVPEVMGIAKLGFRKSVVVQNFWCDKRESDEINAEKLTEGIRAKYFATVDGADAYDITIATNFGLATLLLRETSVYVFLLLGEGGELPMDITLPSNSNWRIERSSDGKSGALVCEVFFARCSTGTGKLETELAEIIITLMDELAVFEKGGC